jgi:hypothetical protein
LCLQLGDVQGIDSSILHLGELSTTAGEWTLFADAARWKAAMAMAMANWEEADRDILDHEHRGRNAPVYAASAAGQRALMAYELGMLKPGHPVFSMLLQDKVVKTGSIGLRANCALDDGDLVLAQELLSTMLANMTGQVNHRNHLCELAFATSALDALASEFVSDGWLKENAEALLDWFSPYENQFVVVAYGEAILGSVNRYLGALHSVLGAHDRAIAYFDDARSAEVERGWHASALRTEVSEVRALIRQCVFTTVLSERIERLSLDSASLHMSGIHRSLRLLADK